MWPSPLFVVVVTFLLGIVRDTVVGQLWPNYPEPGPDIYGKFCSLRSDRCCPDRDDRCTVPILDTVCYCDQFCVRSQADCCPDFSDTCMSNPHPIKAKSKYYCIYLSFIKIFSS
ncbi:hypothetical protein LSH36_667g01085 [Paralvinella palmiformis]|uniref:SMB domain-containing protein n=1 Tax=Paralvinella palmiformis TaxID=53620 RepID=A0AAD9MTW7_9ANNE|nr:hypothetical protein LSH36_667g01085 [Paralvinella palmiformis]